MVDIDHIGDKVVPEDVRDLVGHQCASELSLDAPQLILQAGVVLGGVRRKDILNPTHFINDLKECVVAQVEHECLRLRQI